MGSAAIKLPVWFIKNTFFRRFISKPRANHVNGLKNKECCLGVAKRESDANVKNMLNLVKLQEEEEKTSYRRMPQNIEAEQSLLGALLINNEYLNKIADFLLPEHFFEPVHRRIYEHIVKLSDKGMMASPITLKNYFDKDESLEAIGGGGYLVKLAALASLIVDVRMLATEIYEIAQKRKLIEIGEEVVNSAYDHDVDLPAKLQIERAEQKLFTLSTQGEGDKAFRHLKMSLAEALTRADAAKKRGSKVTGVTTGFEDVDGMLGGMQDSDLIILAGRPSMGKTALAVNIALNACREVAQGEEPGAVGVFSLEMSSEQLASRLLSVATGIGSTNIRRGELTDAEFVQLVRANQELCKLPLFIDDTPALSIAAIRARARRLKRKHNLKFLVIDYLQLLHGVSDVSRDSRTQEVSEITQGLKAIAKELNIPVMALSQLSRAVEQREDKRPQLSDLRESGSIEQDADIVMFIYREEYYLARKMPREGTNAHVEWQEDMNKVMNITEVIIAKQRNGPIGSAKLRFESGTTSFTGYAEG